MRKSYNTLNDMISELGMENKKVIQYAEELEDDDNLSEEQIIRMVEEAEFRLDCRLGK